MFKEVKIGDKVIGVFKGDKVISLTDPEYLAWKSPAAALNNTQAAPTKKPRKKKGS